MSKPDHDAFTADVLPTARASATPAPAASLAPVVTPGVPAVTPALPTVTSSPVEAKP